MEVTKIALDQLRDAAPRSIDLFICSASYEDRCRSIADQLDPSSVKQAVVAETSHLARYVTGNGDHLRYRFRQAVSKVLVDTEIPTKTADSFSAALDAFESIDKRNIVVDITTFTHESLLILVKLLTQRLNSTDSVTFTYASAEDYSVGDEQDKKWLSKGVGEIRSVLGYPGMVLPSRKTHLIVLVGFEHERAAELIKAYEPSIISLGHGTAGSETNEKHRAANDYFYSLVSAMASTYGSVLDFSFACDNPLDAGTAILRQIARAPGYNVIVAPMNTKISTIGAVLASQKDSDIQLCYARAHQYNYRGYSAPGKNCYVIKMPELFDESVCK